MDEKRIICYYFKNIVDVWTLEIVRFFFSFVEDVFLLETDNPRTTLVYGIFTTSR